MKIFNIFFSMAFAQEGSGEGSGDDVMTTAASTTTTRRTIRRGANTCRICDHLSEEECRASQVRFEKRGLDKLFLRYRIDRFFQVFHECGIGMTCEVTYIAMMNGKQMYTSRKSTLPYPFFLTSQIAETPIPVKRNRSKISTACQKCETAASHQTTLVATSSRVPVLSAFHQIH